MKKILIYIIALISLTSCLDGVGYSTSYHVLATFEYEASDVKYRADSTYYSSADAYGMGWNYLCFSHKVNMDGDFLGGFRLSQLEGQIKPEKGEDATDDRLESLLPLDMTWRVHSAPSKNSYMVFWQGASMPDLHIMFFLPTNISGSCTVKSCFVCNTAKVAAEVKEKFERDDKLTLTATGYLDKKKTGSAEIALADYTQNDKSGSPKDSIVSTWTAFDLSKLGAVDEVRFEMTGTKSVSHYFCLDDFLASISIEY